MKPVVWIVSYPRSGNTYLRALLANYFSGVGRPLALGEISAATLGEHDEVVWTRLTGQAPAERTLESQWSARAAYIGERRREATGARPLFKAHTLNGSVFGLPAFEFAPGDRIVHVMRHPGDVALSCADYWGLTPDQAIERLLAPGTVIDGRPDHGFEVIGSWEQHTRSWLAPTGAQAHRVRYFDLVEDTVETLRGIVAFLGEEPDPRRLRAATAFSAFDTLSAQEEVAGFTEATQAQSSRFFRVGRTLQWPGRLSADQMSRLTAPVEDLLEELGFNAFVTRRLAASG